MYKIIFFKSKKLTKDFKILKKNKEDYIYVYSVLKKLQKEPFHKKWKIKKIEPKEEKLYRLKIRNIRIIYKVDFGNQNILIVRVGYRKDVYS